MSKKKFLEIIDGVENWDQLSEKISKISNNNEKKAVFILFSKYYFLSQPSVKEDYRNVWDYGEIPKEIKNKYNLSKIKHSFDLLLEPRKGNFILVKTLFNNEINSNLEIDSFFNLNSDIKNRLFITNLVLEKKENVISYENFTEMKKNVFRSIKSQLKDDPETKEKDLSKYLSIYKFSGRAINLVWNTSKNLTVIIAVLTLISGLLPAGVAYLSKLIIDAVIEANKNPNFINNVFMFLFIEALLVIFLEAARRGLNIAQSLLIALLGQKVKVLILEKALKLDLTHYENSEFYDKMTRARREASTRPLSLVNRTFNLIQSILSLIAYGGLLLNFSYLAVIGLFLTSIPAFIAEAKFANQAFRLFSWRAPEAREQMYLETLIAREDFAKEVKLFQLGNLFLDRYKNIFSRLYAEDKELTISRGIWSYLLGSLSTVAFYLLYAWIIYETVKGKISLGEMTMYIMVFRQGQATLSGALSSIGGMYEDNLYLSSLYEFLEQDIKTNTPKILLSKENTIKVENINKEGIVFENVSFSYPNSSKHALQNISLKVNIGEKLAIVGGNGSGKTTLIKLLTRLYNPTEGRILLHGKDLQEWDIDELHKKIGVIFQDFIHYQFNVGENIGVGDIDNMEDSQKWLDSSEKGMALPFIKDLPAGFKTQLGTWFRGGQELSLGQWQKIALSRAFMREKAEILVLDEPTSAMDAEAEGQVFEQFKNLTKDQMVILISHRFSTVRNADKIVVIENSKLLEYGTHEELMLLDGKYAKLFTLQASSYQ